MSRAVPLCLLPVKHKLGGNRAFHVGHRHRKKEKTEEEVNAKEKGNGIQIPLAFPKEVRIKEEERGHI